MSQASWKGYIIPALVFQSVMVVGGYGTGREFVEYFLSLGPIAGLFGIGVTTIIWMIMCALTFEFARCFKAHDYRRFFIKLLGKGWVVFEVSYILMLVIVLGIIGSTAGSILQQTLGAPYWLGTVLLTAYILYIVMKGKDRIENELSFWALALYVVFFTFFFLCFKNFGQEIQHQITRPQETGGWLMNGLKYASYNLGFIPGVLFATRHIKTSKQAIGSGVLAGLFGVLPGILFYFAMVSQYPTIIAETVPSNYMLNLLSQPILTFLFYLVLFATLISTGTGLIHAFNERIAHFANEKKIKLQKHFRLIIALCCMTVSVLVSQIGLKFLVAKGYGMMSWFMMGSFIFPLLTVGIYKLIFCRGSAATG